MEEGQKGCVKGREDCRNTAEKLQPVSLQQLGLPAKDHMIMAVTIPASSHDDSSKNPSMDGVGASEAPLTSQELIASGRESKFSLLGTWPLEGFLYSIGWPHTHTHRGHTKWIQWERTKKRRGEGR